MNVVTITEGYNTELTCTVHAEPRAHVSWLKNGELLNTASEASAAHGGNHRYVQTNVGSRHVLSIDNVQSHDFANYTCVGQNRFGQDHKTIEMTGISIRFQFCTISFHSIKIDVIR